MQPRSSPDASSPSAPSGLPAAGLPGFPLVQGRVLPRAVSPAADSVFCRATSFLLHLPAGTREDAQGDGGSDARPDRFPKHPTSALAPSRSSSRRSSAAECPSPRRTRRGKANRPISGLYRSGAGWEKRGTEKVPSRRLAVNPAGGFLRGFGAGADEPTAGQQQTAGAGCASCPSR